MGDRPYLPEHRPEFDDDQRKHGISDDDLWGFLLDILRAPRQLKDAHWLHLPEGSGALWSAKLNAKAGQFVVLYSICDGGQQSCYGACDLTAVYNCTAPVRRIVLRRVGPHDDAYRRATGKAKRRGR